MAKQADDKSLDEILLADDDFTEFVKRCVKAPGFDRFVDGVDSSVHVGFPMLRERVTGIQPARSNDSFGMKGGLRWLDASAIC